MSKIRKRRSMRKRRWRRMRMRRIRKRRSMRKRRWRRMRLFTYTIDKVTFKI